MPLASSYKQGHYESDGIDEIDGRERFFREDDGSPCHLNGQLFLLDPLRHILHWTGSISNNHEHVVCDIAVTR
jgi:hypothetical protein